MSIAPPAAGVPRWRQRLRPVEVTMLAVVLVYLWLVSNQAMTALGPAGHDDHLYLNMAKSLASGRWLGSYGNLTLAKGPFYSFFIAASFVLGIPLFLSQHVLYALACGVLVAALSPLLPRATERVALFVVLLFNPATFAGGVWTRAIREGIYPSLTLLVLSCAVAIAVRADRRLREQWRWAAGLAASLAALWLCREERVWIVPPLFLIGGWAFVRSTSRRELLLLSGCALALFAALVGSVVLKNWWHYGLPVITEFTEGPFPGAYAALGRVRHLSERPKIPLPEETRLRLYGVSPAFAELKPFMEGEIGRGWSVPGCNEAGICGDIAAGWLMWALRDAAAAAGHYRDAREAARFWREVRTQVADACQDGRIACGGLSAGFLPPLRWQNLASFPAAFARGSYSVASFNLVTGAHPSPSMGPEWLLVDFRDLTRERLEPMPGGSEPKVPLQEHLAGQQERILDGIITAYHRVTPVAVCAALGALLFATILSTRLRRTQRLLVVSGLFLVAAATRIAFLTLVSVTTFPALSAGYLSPAYPLLLCFAVLALALGIESILILVNTRPSPAADLDEAQGSRSAGRT